MRKIFKLASMEKKSIHVCPNGCDSRQETVVSVLQPWSVDAEGQLLERLSANDDTISGPNNDNKWTCLECGAETELIHCRAFSDSRMTFYIPDNDEEPHCIFVLPTRRTAPEKVALDERGKCIYNRCEIILQGDGSVSVEPIQEENPESATTYTVHRYGKSVEEILDMTQFEDAEYAIQYAMRNECDEVVNDQTGEVIYTKPDKAVKWVVSYVTNGAATVAMISYKTQEEALRNGVDLVAKVGDLNMWVMKYTNRPTAPTWFISYKNIVKLMDECGNDIDAVVVRLMAHEL